MVILLLLLVVQTIAPSEEANKPAESTEGEEEHLLKDEHDREARDIESALQQKPQKRRINFSLIQGTKSEEAVGNFAFDRPEPGTNGIDAMQIYQDLWGDDTSSVRSGSSYASAMRPSVNSLVSTPEKNFPSNYQSTAEEEYTPSPDSEKHVTPGSADSEKQPQHTHSYSIKESLTATSSIVVKPAAAAKVIPRIALNF